MDNLQQYLPLLVLFAGLAFLFYMSSKQRRKAAEKTQKTQNALSVGTPITMTSGVYGIVSGLQERTIDVEVSADVHIRVLRQAVLEVRTELEDDEVEEYDETEYDETDAVDNDSTNDRDDLDDSAKEIESPVKENKRD